MTGTTTCNTNDVQLMTRWPPLATLGFVLGVSALLWALIIVAWKAFG